MDWADEEAAKLFEELFGSLRPWQPLAECVAFALRRARVAGMRDAAKALCSGKMPYKLTSWQNGVKCAADFVNSLADAAEKGE
jgi:hypothetical protein